MYFDVFFKPESKESKQANDQWQQYAIKQKLFGNSQTENKGLIGEIKETIDNNKKSPK